MEQTRPPIVTILGHVDHGKTTLLDFIRKTSVAAKEHGGITQHIGAYQTEFGGKQITFIDTPGHAAFEKMRGRGARVADIAVLVVALDDGVMPQTVEAIKHIQGVKAPMIVAINKCDKVALTSPGGENKIDLSNPQLKVPLEKIKKQLSDQNVVIEEYGGEVPLVPISAKTGFGVDKLLEIITLVAEMAELKGDPSLEASGVVIESNLDKFKGPIATILIRNGTLKKGDQILLGGVKSKVRGMFDWNGKAIDNVTPSTPVEVLGLESVPAVGSVLGEEAESQKVTEVANLVDRLRTGENKSLKLVVKADKAGSLEAIQDGLEKLNEGEKSVEIVSSGTGDIGEADIKLASSVKGIVIGFNVKVAPSVAKIAETEHVLIRTYNIIYELIDEMAEVVEGLIKPGVVEENLGKAKVLAVFPHGETEKIAGCKILEGYFTRGIRIRVYRDESSIGEGKVKNIRKVKEEVDKADKGTECGILFDPQLDFAVGDIIESFRVI